MKPMNKTIIFFQKS